MYSKTRQLLVIGITSLVLVGAGCTSAPVVRDQAVTIVRPTTPFPVELIGRKSPVSDTWVEPVVLQPIKGCVTNPTGDLGTEVVDPRCAVWSEAVVSSDKSIVAQVIPKDKTSMTGALRFMRKGKQMPLPGMSVDAATSVSVTYVDEHTVLVETGGYEWRKQVRLQENSWQEVSVPEPVLAAFPWTPKPPFELVLGEKFDRYTETRWPPSAEGYFGDDEYRSKWALTYVVDRSTGQVVDTGVVARQ